MQLDWPNIETVLLDMDGTLLDLHFDTHFWLDYLPSVYARENGMSKQDAVELIMPMIQGHASTLEYYCVDFWSDTLRVDIMALKRDVAHKIAYRPFAREFLEQCSAETNDVRMLTNAHRKVLDLKIEFTQIDRYFNTLYCSHELDAPKEKQEFWDNLQKMHGFDPRKSLFLDDSEAVLDAANDYGIKHVFSIASPDSQRPRTLKSQYQMIERFHV